MKTKTWRLPVLLGIVATTSLLVFAGDLEPPGPPAPTMVTLQELYDRMAPAPDTCFDDVGRFVVCGDGSVKDNLTGLVWLEDANCLGGGRIWPDAGIWAAQLADGQCGLTDGSFAGDWRLPTEVEWQAILDQSLANGCAAPFFPDVSGLGCCSTGTCPLSGLVLNLYWTSDTLSANPALARVYSVNIGQFTQLGKANGAFLMAVRELR